MVTKMQHQFYNISRVMDCVSCDKCRLNGKLQIRGLATTLKLLFLPNNMREDALKNLQEAEIVSLMQLFSRLSETISILEKFKESEDKGTVEQMSLRTMFALVVGFMLVIAAKILMDPNFESKKSSHLPKGVVEQPKQQSPNKKQQNKKKR